MRATLILLTLLICSGCATTQAIEAKYGVDIDVLWQPAAFTRAGKAIKKRYCEPQDSQERVENRGTFYFANRENCVMVAILCPGDEPVQVALQEGC